MDEVKAELTPEYDEAVYAVEVAMDEIRSENGANAAFIAVVHDLMPEILERLRAILHTTPKGL